MSKSDINKPVKIKVADMKVTSDIKFEPVKMDATKEIQIVETAQNDQQSSSNDLIRFKEQQSRGLKGWFWPTFSTFVVGAASYQAYQFVQQLFNTHWLLGATGLAVGGVALISGAVALFKSWRSRKRLSKRQKLQQQFDMMIQKQTYGQASEPLKDLTQEIGEYVELGALEKQFLVQKQQFHNDHELIQIYSGTVLKGLDKMALDIISKHASEAAVMVALSPLAAADMALVAWRSNRMIQELSRLYGCPQTAFGRIDMSKQVFKNMMLAGASEMVAEAGTELLGKTLTATISTKVAQGIGVGILISRMGIQTMRLCRPVEFTEQDKPKLSDLRKAIIGKVKSYVLKKEPDKKHLEKNSSSNKESITETSSGDSNDRN